MAEAIEDEDAILAAAADDAEPAADGDTDAELEKLRAKWQEMEQEAKIISELGKQEADATAGDAKATVDREELDARSVYVGNVDYMSTPEDLQNHLILVGR